MDNGVICILGVSMVNIRTYNIYIIPMSTSKSFWVEIGFWREIYYVVIYPCLSLLRSRTSSFFYYYVVFFLLAFFRDSKETFLLIFTIATIAGLSYIYNISIDKVSYGRSYIIKFIRIQPRQNRAEQRCKQTRMILYTEQARIIPYPCIISRMSTTH